MKKKLIISLLSLGILLNSTIQVFGASVYESQYGGYWDCQRILDSGFTTETYRGSYLHNTRSHRVTQTNFSGTYAASGTVAAKSTAYASATDPYNKAGGGSTTRWYCD